MNQVVYELFHTKNDQNVRKKEKRREKALSLEDEKVSNYSFLYNNIKLKNKEKNTSLFIL